MLEKGEGNIQLARQLFKCAVKADPASEASWLVSAIHALHALQSCLELRLGLAESSLWSAHPPCECTCPCS